MAEPDLTPNSNDQPLLPNYAFWNVPGSALKVVYSLPLFHEIDFLINEGYRKIPHGGIEVGGLLFGSTTVETIRIEAFRPIVCEHASGPSLNLSERDLAALDNQLAAAPFDSELKGLQPIGWVLARTRSPLKLTDTEVTHFDRFFPQPVALTLLVKPERFQPTRFIFLVRQAELAIPREATSTAVILPLPGRSQKSGELLASIAAPAVSSTPKSSQPRDRARNAGEVPDIEVRDIEDEPKPAEEMSLPPQFNQAANANVAPPEELPTAAERRARRQSARDRVRVMEQAYPPLQSQPADEFPASEALPAHTAQADQLSLVPFKPARSLNATAPPSLINLRSVTALALAALLGCLVGYLAYLQLPAPIIPLDVRSVNQTVVVSWPADETRNSIYAAIRFNDGAPVPLSAEEKMAGQVSLAAAGDFKLEVMARNWARDSRGIVRFMHSPAGSQPAAIGVSP